MMSANEGAASSQPSIKKPTPPTPSRKTEATLGQGPVACRFSTNSKEKSFGVLPWWAGSFVAPLCAGWFRLEWLTGSVGNCFFENDPAFFHHEAPLAPLWDCSQSITKRIIVKVTITNPYDNVGVQVPDTNEVRPQSFGNTVNSMILATAALIVRQLSSATMVITTTTTSTSTTTSKNNKRISGDAV